MAAPRQSDLLNDASVLSLRSFVAVVETQSFSSAARQLRLAPSSVTKHVQTLEDGLKLALLHRSTRRLRLTEAGERFYERCLAILGEIDTLAGVILRERELTGHLRVTAPPSFAMTVFGPNLHGFLQEHPGITVDLLVTSAAPDLVRDRVDVAIRIEEAPDTKLHHQLLAAAPRILCASPEYLGRRGVPRAPGELAGHVCLSARFSEAAETWTLRRGEEEHVVGLKSQLLCDNGDVLRHAALRGAGIGNFYRFHVHADLRTGGLVPVLPEFLPRPRNIYAVTPHRQLVRPQASAFIAFTRMVLDRQGA
ncbi:LysR family transcriptional regulator [Rhodovastum atsumiense]|uniref:LysR family transcriptional regulator n=1 Tax=Rhodovastum atsumiense TaxID=504468 RepID=A0A5M6IWB2_9PROT|nr:LysR family transcriptional regulator [Rhodovastum atsumiense]KAA5612259.1 LysR family transcriptional regulator [Rhodovastum atsumiense]CAH2601582.1 LysR family transcriptional regulator [Rhodovastum atsumiense]